MKFLITLLLLIITTTAHAERPSRRSILQKGQQHLQTQAARLRSNAREGLQEVYTSRVVPHLNFAFRYPEDWKVGLREEYTSKLGQYYHSDGDYVSIEDESYAEDYVMFMYSKQFNTPTTLEMVLQEWEDVKKQPEPDNTFEGTYLSYVRELDIIKQDITSFQNKPALELEYTFTNRSKMWKTRAVMFPVGNRIYTIKYRAELSAADRFLGAYHTLRDSFRFLTTPERPLLRSQRALNIRNRAKMRAMRR